MRRHVLDGRLAAAAGHADNAQSARLAAGHMMPRQIAVGSDGIRRDQIRDARILLRFLRQNAEGRTALRRRFRIEIAVEVFAAQCEKAVACGDRPRIRAESADRKRRICAVLQLHPKHSGDLGGLHPQIIDFLQ